MCTGDTHPPLIWSSAAFYATFACPHCLAARPLVFDDPLRDKASLPELHTDPDLILPETEATLFFHTLPSMRAPGLHAALKNIPGLSGIQCRRYLDTLSQIKWDIYESKGGKLLILKTVLALPRWDVKVYNIMYLWFEGKETKEKELLWIPLTRIDSSWSYYTLPFYLQICLHISSPYSISSLACFLTYEKAAQKEYWPHIPPH